MECTKAELYEKQFRKVLEMHAETRDKLRKTEARMLLQRWRFLNALAKARKTRFARKRGGEIRRENRTVRRRKRGATD